MTGIAAHRLARVLALANAIMVIGGLTILLLTLAYPPLGGWGFRGFPLIFAVGSGLVGWLIMTRRPENRIGPLLALVGVLNAGQLFLTEYAAAAARLGLFAGDAAAWVNAMIWVPTLGLMAGGVPLLFPDGRLASGRWRVVAGLLVAGSVIVMVALALYPDALNTPRFVRRPITVPIDDATLNSMAYLGLLVLGIGIVGAGLSLVLRWRRATGTVRQQLKWLAASVVLVVATMWLAIVPNTLAVAVFIAAIGSVPLAIGIAVLRYRLYEIDAVISRTLVFGALTAILTGGFAALQKLFQTVFVAVTGNESDAATIITTLVLATSFVPLKKALESIAERRLGPRLAPEPSSPAAPSGPPPAGVMTSSPAELEAMLRRVVREELRDSLAVHATADGSLGAASEAGSQP